VFERTAKQGDRSQAGTASIRTEVLLIFALLCAAVASLMGPPSPLWAWSGSLVLAAVPYAATVWMAHLSHDAGRSQQQPNTRRFRWLGAGARQQAQNLSAALRAGTTE
jgi:hypothetical protein